jgi:hypothetical protein
VSVTRQKKNINRGWEFSFEESAWQSVGIPHSFDLPYFRTPEFRVGVGRYRKHFTIDADWSHKRVFLEFEGVFQIAEIFVNGRRMGGHEGGYTGFSIDITEAVRAGGNLLEVRVDNNWSARIAPRAGEHVFCGGIYRDVYLVATDPVHVAWHGVAVTTPKVSATEAMVNVSVETSKACRVVHQIFDAEGKLVAEGEGESIGPIVQPKLWHPDHPYLYKIVTKIFDGDRLADEVETPLGLRWFEWTKDRGFFLNGEHLYLRGANAHQDHSGWGIAITQAACYRDVKLIKDAGFNFVRGAHYPHHPAFAEACDRLGVIFWSENCFWGKGGFGPKGYWNASAYPVNADDCAAFEESCKSTLREMIRINRNHPSIMAWSMTNEAFFTYNLDRARGLIGKLVKLSRELDPTRPAAIGGSQRGDVDKLGDIAGYNGDGARLFIDPGVPNMVSEYGAISKPVNIYEPFFGELQGEKFAWRSGEAIWCGFDYGSIAGKQGLKGIVRYDRLPKRSWYWYQNEILKIPPPVWPEAGVAAKLRLSTDQSTIEGTDATDDCQIVVAVLDAAGKRISDCPVVTLTIESGPGEFPTGRKITFDPAGDIVIAEGEAAIAFRSYEGGRTVIRATSPGLEDATLEIATIGFPEFIEGKTAVAADRPYFAPNPSAAALAAMKNIVNVARDRPSRASSEAADHPARLANDGDAGTFWQSAADDSQPWIQVDMEGFYQVSGLRLVFKASGNSRYQVDVSSDGAEWSGAVDRTRSIRTDPIRNDIFEPGTVCRYVRVIFTSEPPAHLCEIEVFGVLWVR